MTLRAAWLEQLRSERGCSPATVLHYGRELAALERLAGARQWPSITEDDVRRAVAQAARDGLAPRSIARRLSAWRSWFEFLGSRGVVAANPARGVRPPRAARRLPKALAPDLAVRLAEAPDGAAGTLSDADAFAMARDHAIVELLYSSGLRLSELVGLDERWTDDGGVRSEGWLDLAQAEVTVLGKGRKRRTVPVGRAACTALSRWCEVRAAWLARHPGADPRPLFLGSRGTRLSPRSVQLRVAAWARARGMPARVHPHVLRHSMASHVLQSSGDLRAVQELLGHADIATTQVYTSLDFQRLAAVYDAAHPRARRR